MTLPLVEVVVAIMGVLVLLSLVQTSLLYRIARGLGSVQSRVDSVERRLRKFEE